MFLSFIDVIKYVPFIPCRLDQIPHTQGFYLIFNEDAEFIYVGKGYGDERVKIHFNMSSEKEFIDEACFWLWFQTNDEDKALAYERAVYEVYVQKTGTPPKYNKKVPEGARESSQFAMLENSLAKQDWQNFLSNIRELRLYSKNY
jgi:excinuclease UvrABC nuclease subunit